MDVNPGPRNRAGRSRAKKPARAMHRILSIAYLIAASPTLLAAPEVHIALPERCRLLTRQYFDLRVEARGLADASGATLVLRDELGSDLSSRFGAVDEVTTDNDPDPATLDKAWVFRAESFPTEGVQTIVAEVRDASGTGSDTRKIGVQRFKTRPANKKNLILFIGDGMGQTYRDAGRIVSRSTGNRFRGGFFDQLLEMDRMPYLGMVLTHSHNELVPDSANTASAWASGNKTVNGALNVFPDNNDWRGTPEALLDNPRFETLWSYLRRLHGYKTGIVTTTPVTDATPAAEGSYTLWRGLGMDIARQFVDGTFASGPVFDVILGGGRSHFNQRTFENSGDSRDLIQELVSLGYVRVDDRTSLNALQQTPDRLVGLFHSDTMTVAYDKLGYQRPADEPSSANTAFPDQPFLEEMTSKAIASLSKNGAPFILMVEGGSIDKQSHGNQAVGTIWDVIEFDRAIGVGRTFARTNPKRPTLVLATADHNQSMQVLGVFDSAVPEAFGNVRAESGFFGLPGGVGGFPDYAAAPITGYPRNDNRYRLAVGFRTHDHTASPVPISAEGPGASLFTGVWDQTDLFFKMGRVLESDTTKLDRLEKERQRLQIVDQNYGDGN
jgi:alkaline phosphatase